MSNAERIEAARQDLVGAILKMEENHKLSLPEIIDLLNKEVANCHDYMKIGKQKEQSK